MAIPLDYGPRVCGSFQVITDHPLIGGQVPPQTNPLDVYRDFMAVPDVLAGKWAGLEKDMKDAGIKDPRLAVTELQMFAHISRPADPKAQNTIENPQGIRPLTSTVGVENATIRIDLMPFTLARLAVPAAGSE